MLTQLLWGWSHLKGQKTATLHFYLLGFNFLLVLPQHSEQRVQWWWRGGGGWRTPPPLIGFRTSDNWQRGTKDEVRHHQRLITCRLRSLYRAGKTKVGFECAARLQHRQQQCLYLDWFTDSRFIENGLHLMPIINQLGHKLNPWRTVLRERGLLPSTLSCWEKQQREPKVFSPIRISENSHRPFPGWMHTWYIWIRSHILSGKESIKNFWKRGQFWIRDRGYWSVTFKPLIKPYTVLSIRHRGMSAKPPQLCADTLPFDRWAVVRPSGCFSEKEEEGRREGRRRKSAGGPWDLTGSTALFTYCQPQWSTTHIHHNRFLIILLMSLCFLAGLLASGGTEITQSGRGNAAKDSLQWPHTHLHPKKKSAQKSNNVHQQQGTSYESMAAWISWQASALFNEAA